MAPKAKMEDRDAKVVKVSAFALYYLYLASYYSMRSLLTNLQERQFVNMRTTSAWKGEESDEEQTEAPKR